MHSFTLIHNSGIVRISKQPVYGKTTSKVRHREATTVAGFLAKLRPVIWRLWPPLRGVAHKLIHLVDTPRRPGPPGRQGRACFVMCRPVSTTLDRTTSRDLPPTSIVATTTTAHLQLTHVTALARTRPCIPLTGPISALARPVWDQTEHGPFAL